MVALTRIAGLLLLLIIFGTVDVITNGVLAHNVSSSDQAFISSGSGASVFVYMYLGAKHMVTGYDHILFLVAVIFYLYRFREIGLYVTLFAVGHSITMILGVLLNLQINPFIIDAIIGFSVVYKAADNLGWWQKYAGVSINNKLATWVFGLLHGFGLATKLQDYGIPEQGLLPKLVLFNVGVEIGQLLALAAILIVMGYWRRSNHFISQARIANYLLICCGVALIIYHANGFFGQHS